MDLEPLEIFALSLENGKYFETTIAGKVILCDLDNLMNALFCLNIA